MTSEIVLPTGEFCEVGIITVADMAAAFTSHGGLLAMSILAHRLAKIDGKSLSLDEVVSMPYSKAAPIFTLLTQQLDSAYKTRLGIA